MGTHQEADVQHRRPTRACLALISCLLLGCGQKQPDPTPEAPAPSVTAPTDSVLPHDIVDVTWQWVGFTTPVEQLSVDAPDRYTVRFERDGRVAVLADCNRGTGGYSVGADRRLTFPPIALTRMACPPGSLGDRFVREVGRASSYFLREGDLYLSLPVDSGTLRFRRQP